MLLSAGQNKTFLHFSPVSICPRARGTAYRPPTPRELSTRAAAEAIPEPIRTSPPPTRHQPARDPEEHRARLSPVEPSTHHPAEPGTEPTPTRSAPRLRSCREPSAPTPTRNQPTPEPMARTVSTHRRPPVEMAARVPSFTYIYNKVGPTTQNPAHSITSSTQRAAADPATQNPAKDIQ